MIKESLNIIKVGGAVVEDEKSLSGLLMSFSSLHGKKILVHGGGKIATEMAGKLGVETQMIDGRRITSAEMLKVVTMVYGGLVNKTIVAHLNTLGIKALGLTGADLSVIRSHRRPPLPDGTDYGLVGDVDSVDSSALSTLLEADIVPVVAPLTLGNGGQLLNTNADTIAASVAMGMAADYEVTLVYCFEKKGVLLKADDDDSVIPHIDSQSYEQLKADGIVSGGMLPKLDNSFSALRAGVKRVVITRADQIADLSQSTTIVL